MPGARPETGGPTASGSSGSHRPPPRSLPTLPALPAIDELNQLPEDELTDVLRLLFEDAPAFLRRLAGARPFDSDEALLARAREIAAALPEPERVELLDAHPRLGADPSTVSALSHREQGYDRGRVTTPSSDLGPEPSPRAEDHRVRADLDRLNEAYEARFGFRFVVFVAGRSRAALVPVLEHHLAAEREAEMRRGLDDVVAIAGDRLRRLRELSDASHPSGAAA